MAWPDRAIVQEALARITWYHNIALLEKVEDIETRLWYAAESVRHGWSRNILVLQIENEAHRRAGLNLYLSATDDLLRHPDDKPAIGLLLCRSKNKIVVEYALRDLKRPIGVAQWETKIVKALPKELKGSLPTVREIERELADDVKP